MDGWSKALSRSTFGWEGLLGPRRTSTSFTASVAAAEKELIAAQRINVGDFFEIFIERAGELGEQAGGAIRYRARAELAGRLFDEVLIDLGATEPLIQEPEIVRGSTLLEFANIAPIEVPTLPLEQHIAEKVHAYTRTYGHGLPSSRAKDLVDLALLGSHASPSAEHLGNALEAVFHQRGLQPLPKALPAPPTDWSAPYRRLATEVGLEPELGEGHHQASLMIDPVMMGHARGKWDPKAQHWVDVVRPVSHVGEPADQ